jgi:cell division protease FtsH
MASAESLPGAYAQSEAAQELASSWRRLTRAATFVALLTSPAVYVWLTQQQGWSWWTAALASLAMVIAFRGVIDLLFHRLIPWPSLFGLESPALREEDVVAHRRVWFWRFWVKVAIVVGVLWFLASRLINAELLVAILPLLVMLPLFLVFNFVILFGPLLLMNLSQIQAFEPGDAQWGVKLDDVRGQLEAKEEVRRVVSIWQSGEQFERAGGKRERGLLFLGAPGTGKTMLAKAIATGFNSPFISIPGSGFAATFIGIDAIIVRILARRAKKLARKWGGQCIVFIDEIDAVGMRRQALGQGAPGSPGYGGYTGDVDPAAFLFYGPHGALNPSGDLILETRAWRERLFAERASRPTPALAGVYAKLESIREFMFPGGMGMGGGLALNQLLVVMDGIDNPPFFKKFFTSKVNAFLDGIYIVPRRIGKVSCRMPAAKPRREQIYFIGATNVPLERLDPALTRPGRMGRHVWFRTPTQQDRLDILDLYIGKVAHDDELDRPKRRQEIARVTNGYSPAMIEQVTSMALTISHHSAREAFTWEDLVEAMTTLEAGTAVGVEYVQKETEAVAIHEAGHAACGHAYMEGAESTRLSIRMRGGSLGHHQALEKEERFGRFQSEMFARLVWGLGAMAAERVFYGENTVGVGGDVQSATAQAASMVGAAAMGPEPFAVTTLPHESKEDAHRRVLQRFEKIGLQIMNRTGGGPFTQDPVSGALSDPAKRALAAQMLGQAYVAAHNLVVHNRDAIGQIAGALTDKREIFGDELLELLDGAKLVIPKVDLSDESAWPPLEFSAQVGGPPRAALAEQTSGNGAPEVAG